jgi:hypothetical protein
LNDAAGILWGIAGYVFATLIFAVLPLGATWLITRSRAWKSRRRWRWAGEVPIWYRNKIELDLPPELLDPPPTRRRRR